MDKKVKTFQYISRHDKPKLEELINNYIYNQMNFKYLELKVDSMTQPIKLQDVYYDTHDKSPMFEVIVTFNSRKLTDEEIENIENCKDVIYDLVIRKNLKDDIVFKINSKEIEFNKYYKIVGNNRIYENYSLINNGFYDNIINPIVKSVENNCEPYRHVNEIKRWLMDNLYKVVFENQIVRMNL
jgi:hypothetical protein